MLPQRPRSPRSALTAPLFALLFLCCTSCSDALIGNAFTETVLVKLPDRHPLYELLSQSSPQRQSVKPSYTAHWYDSEGQRQTLTNLSDDFEITLETGVCTPVLLVCETSRFGIPDGSLPTAGGIYPGQGRVASFGDGMGAVLETSWVRGISAELAEAICLSSAGGFDTGRSIASLFNWGRLVAGLSAINDPTHIDRVRFVRAALSGHFTKYDISYRKIIPVDLATLSFLPPSSVFIPAWAPSAGYTQYGAETLTIPACEGINRYFCQSGYLTVQITLDKPACAFFTPYILPD